MFAVIGSFQYACVAAAVGSAGHSHWWWSTPCCCIQKSWSSASMLCSFIIDAVIEIWIRDYSGCTHFCVCWWCIQSSVCIKTTLCLLAIG